MAAANRHEPKELCSVEFVIKFALQIDISINYQERTVIFNMVDTNDFSVFGIAPYYFFAGIGLMLAVSPDKVERVKELLDEPVYELGRIVKKADASVVIK